VLQKDVEDKLEGQSNQRGGLRSNANSVALHGRYDKKKKYAGHVLIGSSGLSHLQILARRIKGKQKVGSPRRTWIKDMLDWTRIETYDKVNRELQRRERAGEVWLADIDIKSRDEWILKTHSGLPS